MYVCVRARARARVNHNNFREIPHFPVHKTHFFSPEKCDLIRLASYEPRVSIISRLINTLPASNENHDDDFSGSDDDFLGFYDE